ncbi:MFS transporter [Nocardioides cavernaquae]|uniref:MFS transporter n=1 Tax=Nocardioides cavernaquae TaxID=2321396 RepID=A0A3A5H7I4_9ACTN|nr:MFS transporter [Nocardioides cavernaquae]RJS46412.1 MFS transporter [Nocardioides cavernaquae]
MASTSRSWVPVAGALVVGGWGANQFTPLSVVYRVDEGWGQLPVITMFTIYLLGLVPALLVGCRLADRFGRRRVVRLALVLQVASSVGLAGAAWSEYAVYGSRMATGVATGLIVSAAGAWLQELSSDVTPGQGARRAVYATGAGFAFGPVAAGAMAEWLPLPLVLPCFVHAACAALALLAAARVPETAPAWTAPSSTGPAAAGAPGVRRTALMHPRFLGLVLPASPAIFAAVTVSYVVLPPLVHDQVRDIAPLFSGLIAAVTLSVGLAIQPLAARIDRPGSSRATLTAMATVVVGLLAGALAVDQRSPALVVLAAALLGAGYGLTLESGLTEINRITPPSALPTVSALFQGVAHSGFLAPLLLAIMAGSASYPELLAGLALIGLVLLIAAALWDHHHVEDHTDHRLPGLTGADVPKGAEPWAE